MGKLNVLSMSEKEEQQQITNTLDFIKEQNVSNAITSTTLLGKIDELTRKEEGVLDEKLEKVFNEYSQQYFNKLSAKDRKRLERKLDKIDESYEQFIYSWLGSIKTLYQFIKRIQRWLSRDSKSSKKDILDRIKGNIKQFIDFRQAQQSELFLRIEPGVNYMEMEDESAHDWQPTLLAIVDYVRDMEPVVSALTELDHAIRAFRKELLDHADIRLKEILQNIFLYGQELDSSALSKVNFSTKLQEQMGNLHNTTFKKLTEQQLGFLPEVSTSAKAIPTLLKKDFSMLTNTPFWRLAPSSPSSKPLLSTQRNSGELLSSTSDPFANILLGVTVLGVVCLLAVFGFLGLNKLYRKYSKSGTAAAGYPESLELTHSVHSRISCPSMISRV